MFKINISTKEGKTYKFELESEVLTEKELHATIQGNDLLPSLEGYEFEIRYWCYQRLVEAGRARR